MAFYGIHGALGARLFEIVTRHRHDAQLYFSDLVMAKATYEKGSPQEIEAFTYSLLDLLGDGHVPAETRHLAVLRREHAWHIAGMLEEKDARILVPGPTVVVVRDKGGSVFGGFASHPWARSSEFFGDMKSFLFSLAPACAVYRPSGANANIQWCGVNYVSESFPNGIGFGGQAHHFGLFVNASLERGHSRPSITFNSPSLSSTPEFEPDCIEIWAVVSENGDGDASGGGSAGGAASKGTIVDRFKEDKAMLNMVGLANASDNVG
eukprot:jgi/Mesen1/2206/ME000152S01292